MSDSYRVELRYEPENYVLRWSWKVWAPGDFRIARWSDKFGRGIAMGHSLTQAGAKRQAERAAAMCAAFAARKAASPYPEPINYRVRP